MELIKNKHFINNIRIFSKIILY